MSESDCLNVKQLIEILKGYPSDMKVLTTWESTLHHIKRQFIYESKKGDLYIDADANCYKKRYAKNPSENE